MTSLFPSLFARFVPLFAPMPSNRNRYLVQNRDKIQDKNQGKNQDKKIPAGNGRAKIAALVSEPHCCSLRSIMGTTPRPLAPGITPSKKLLIRRARHAVSRRGLHVPLLL